MNGPVPLCTLSTLGPGEAVSCNFSSEAAAQIATVGKRMCPRNSKKAIFNYVDAKLARKLAISSGMMGASVILLLAVHFLTNAVARSGQPPQRSRGSFFEGFFVGVVLPILSLFWLQGQIHLRTKAGLLLWHALMAGALAGWAVNLRKKADGPFCNKYHVFQSLTAGEKLFEAVVFGVLVMVSLVSKLPPAPKTHADGTALGGHFPHEAHLLKGNINAGPHHHPHHNHHQRRPSITESLSELASAVGGAVGLTGAPVANNSDSASHVQGGAGGGPDGLHQRGRRPSILESLADLATSVTGSLMDTITGASTEVYSYEDVYTDGQDNQSILNDEL